MPVTIAFKAALARGEIQFGAADEPLRIALFTSAAQSRFNVDDLESYSATNEVTGSGYTAGGALVPGVDVLEDETLDRAYVPADPVTWANATISGIRYALLYAPNSTNRAIAYWDFGTDQSVANQNLVLTPGRTASNAMIALG